MHTPTPTRIQTLKLLLLTLVCLSLVDCRSLQTRAFETVRIVPVDEGRRDGSFAQFRKRLIHIVRGRNAGELMRHVSPDIKISFGGGGGRADFKKMWQLNKRPRNSRLWRELGVVLQLGGTFQKGNPNSFWAPCTFRARFASPAKGPPRGHDIFHVLIGRNVHVRARPAQRSRSLRQDSYLIVKYIYRANEERQTIGGQTHAWKLVQLPDGRKGYVYGRYLRSNLAYRAGFTRTQGRWMLDFFVSGD